MMAQWTFRLARRVEANSTFATGDFAEAAFRKVKGMQFITETFSANHSFRLL